MRERAVEDGAIRLMQISAEGPRRYAEALLRGLRKENRAI